MSQKAVIPPHNSLATKKTIWMVFSTRSLSAAQPLPKPALGGFLNWTGNTSLPRTPSLWCSPLRFPASAGTQHPSALGRKNIKQKKYQWRRLLWDFSCEVIPQVCEGNELCRVPGELTLRAGSPPRDNPSGGVPGRALRRDWGLPAPPWAGRTARLPLQSLGKGFQGRGFHT